MYFLNKKVFGRHWIIQMEVMLSTLLLKAELALISDQAAQAFIHLGLKNFQRQKFHSVCGYPISMFNYPHREKDFSY